VPEGYSREKMIVTEALGGEIVYTPRDAGMQGAIQKARELAKEIPNSFIPQQFEIQPTLVIITRQLRAEIEEQPQ